MKKQVLTKNVTSSIKGIGGIGATKKVMTSASKKGMTLKNKK